MFGSQGKSIYGYSARLCGGLSTVVDAAVCLVECIIFVAFRFGTRIQTHKHTTATADKMLALVNTTCVALRRCAAISQMGWFLGGCVSRLENRLLPGWYDGNWWVRSMVNERKTNVRN